MKIDPQSLYIGMGVVATVAGGLGMWRRRLSRMFAGCLAVLVAFEFVCLIVGLEFLVPVWWAVHLPSALALGADEILERHGAFVSTAFHLGDFFLWSALITGAFWFRDGRRRYEDFAKPGAPPKGGPATRLGNSETSEEPPSVS